MRTWFFIWNNYPPNYLNLLKPVIVTSSQHFFQPMPNDHFLYGFFHFKSAVAYPTMENINLMLRFHGQNIIEWRKGKIRLNAFTKLFCSETTKRDGLKKKTK